MRKSFSLSPHRRWLVIGGFLGASLPLGLPTHARATDVYTASYGGTNDTGGGAPITSGTFTLNPFVITGIYAAGSTTTETLFISDGTATGRLYGLDTLFSNVAVGQTYTATVADSVYQGTEEFKAPPTGTPINFTLQTGTTTVAPQSATLAQAATTINGSTANPFTSGPADSLYASEGSLLFAPVTFTITPAGSGTLSTTGSTTLTDQATGDTVILYKSATAAVYAAGQAYTVTGYEQPYNGSGTQESEIVGATSLAANFAAPKPLYRQTTSGSWTPSTGTDWSTTTAGPGNASWNNDGTYTAFFQKTPTGAVTINAGGIKAAGLEFDVSGYTVASDGAAGDSLTLLNSGLVTVTNATDTATISAPIAGSVGLNKNGAGTLILSGANTYTGTTTITAGTIQVSADTALGDPSAPVALAGGTLQSGLTTSGSTLTLARAISGTGALSAAGGTTLAISGAVNAGTITLPGAGSVNFTNTTGSIVTGLVFQTANGSVQAQNGSPSTGLGIVNLGTGGITAAQTTGNVSASGSFQPTGITIPMAIASAGASLTLNGVLTGSSTIVKTGAGTLIVNSDNTGLTGAGTGTASLRQGTAGTASGGVVSIGAANPAPNYALGTGEFQANGGTISNDSGAAVSLAINDISLGAQDTTATPGGLVFAGGAPITVAGGITLYKGTTAVYQHSITVNTPTTFSGIFGASTTTTTSLGVKISGSSTLTLNGTAPNTFLEPVTIATSGAGAGVIAGKDGAFGANIGITLNAGAQLTINTGVMTGTVNAINDAALITINGTAGTPGSFGKIVLTIGSAQETVGGLFLGTTDGKFAAGYLPAGTYGSTSSGATYQDNNLFSGSGVIMNLGTAVPEPSTWAMLAAGAIGLAAAAFRRGRGHCL